MPLGHHLSVKRGLQVLGGWVSVSFPHAEEKLKVLALVSTSAQGSLWASEGT